MRKKVFAVIIKDDKILLMRRIKNGREFYVFPGGKVKKEENFEAAIKRLLKIEFGLEAEIETFLFRLENKAGVQLYFLIKNYVGEPMISGERRLVINDNNQYCLEWKKLGLFAKLSKLRPKEARDKVNQLILVGAKNE